MFFDRLKKLCDERGISPYKACTDIGLNRAAVAKWKKGSKPSGNTAALLADYFDTSTDYLLGKTDIRPVILFHNIGGTPEQIKTPDQLVLTEGEEKLIQLFRQVPQDRQAMVLQMIEAALKTL